MAISFDNIYKKIKCIHKGNASTIWTVSDDITGNIYVLKEIHRTGLPYNHLQKIDSKIIPKVIAVREENGITYVVEEFIQGQTLQEYLSNKGPLSDDELIEVGIKLCEGLNILHQQNVIHRDIKPSNIMLTNDGNVKLIDFDAARVFKKGNTQDTCFIGTTSFAPPELLNEGQTCQQSDIFSLGATFRALLPDGYKGKLTAILDKCTMHDIRKRYSNVKKLRSALISKRKRSFSFKKLLIGLIFICGAGVAVAVSGPTIFTDLDSEQTQQVEEKKAEDTVNVDDSKNADDSTKKTEQTKPNFKYKHYFDDYAGFSFDYPDLKYCDYLAKQRKPDQIGMDIYWEVKSERIFVRCDSMSSLRNHLPEDGSFTTAQMLDFYKKYPYLHLSGGRGNTWRFATVESEKILGDHAIEIIFKGIDKDPYSSNSIECFAVKRVYIGKPGRKDMPDYSPNPKVPPVDIRIIELYYENRLSPEGKAIWEHVSNSYNPGLLLD